MALASLALLLSRPLRTAGLALIAFTWCLFCFQQRLDDRLDVGLAGQWLTLTGTVVSIPRVTADAIHFQFKPDGWNLPSHPPARIMLSGYREWPDIRTGQRWRLQARLKPPWGRVNFSGADRERWFFANGIGAVGSISGGELLAENQGLGARTQVLRERIGQAIDRAVSDAAGRAVIRALAIADRNDMSDEIRSLLTLTGTTHLLAISGLHIGLAALGGAVLARAALGLLLLGRAGRFTITLSGLVGIAVALAYALLADLGVSTLRSVAMLLAGVVALLASRVLHPLHTLLLALAAVLLLDPFAPLLAGFWFSFLAVLALLLLFRTRTTRRSRFRALVMAQGAVITVLLPVSASWFGAFSLSGLAANLVAIPWVSLFLVPFVLGGIALLPLAPELAELAWAIAARSVSILLAVLELFSLVQGELVSLTRPRPWQLAVALAGSLLLLLPAALRWRFYGLFLLLPLFLPVKSSGRAGSIEAEVLDVGQGTSLIVTTAGKTLLYDSGPGDGGANNLVHSVIEPALASNGVNAPDRIVISHGDMDHAGGLYSLLKRYPDARFMANLPPGLHALPTCRAGQEWSWNGVVFTVLHPSAGLPYLGNDSSCVLSVVSQEARLLITGDISSLVESRLLAEGLPAHAAVLVPHHGSLSSSGRAFIERLNADVAVVTAGLGNRFGFPREEIVSRYRQADTRLWSTSDCGAVRFSLDSTGEIRASSARRERNRIWRWPAAHNCP